MGRLEKWCGSWNSSCSRTSCSNKCNAAFRFFCQDNLLFRLPLELTHSAGLFVGESCLQWPPWMRCLCTNSSADGSVQKWSAVFILVYSKAHGPTEKREGRKNKWASLIIGLIYLPLAWCRRHGFCCSVSVSVWFSFLLHSSTLKASISKGLKEGWAKTPKYHSNDNDDWGKMNDCSICTEKGVDESMCYASLSATQSLLCTKRRGWDNDGESVERKCWDLWFILAFIRTGPINGCEPQSQRAITGLY